MNNNGITRAQERVKEMNRMTQHYVQQGNNFVRTGNLQQMQPRFEPLGQTAGSARPSEAAAQPRPPVQPVASELKQKHLSTSFNIDNEKLLLIMIIVLLIKENADIKLIAALAYLLL